MLTRRKPLLAAIALLAAVAGLVSWGLAQGPVRPAVTSTGVILLRNGQVLCGEITPNGDRYDVSVGGGRISVKATDVDLCCSSLEGVYQQKRARLTLPDARDYLDLARWCQQHGLWERAREELRRAETIEPKHPLIPLLRRSLELSESRPVADVAGGAVGTASFNSDELDRLVREMPAGTVEWFSQTIQPLLVNRCAAAACHGPGATTQFSLLRPSPGRPPSRRLTQRNLSAVLDWVDRQDAAASRILTAPIRPHGTLEKAVFTEHDAAQYRQLVDWVQRVAGQGLPSNAAAVAVHLEDAHPDPGQSSPQSRPAAPLVPVAEEPGTSPASARSWAEELEGLNLDLGSPQPPETGLYQADLPPPGLIEPQPNVRRGGALPQFVPRDPFDPEIFNRRFFGSP